MSDQHNSGKYRNYYLLLDSLQIEGANAISSPITYGFPAVNGFLGAIHNLNRTIHNSTDIFIAQHKEQSTTYQELQKIAKSIFFDGVLIACHKYRLHAYREKNHHDYSFIQTRQPLEKTGKSPAIIEEGTPAIIEEGKIDLTISLIVRMRVYDDFPDDEQSKHLLATIMRDAILQQRIAGGTVIKLEKTKLFKRHEVCPQEDIPRHKTIRNYMKKSFVLLDASQELNEIHREECEKNSQPDKKQPTRLDTLIDICTLQQIPTTASNDNDPDKTNDSQSKVSWTTRSKKTGRGWLVPIPLGYQSIADINQGEINGCRSSKYESQYVEALYGLAKWQHFHTLDPAKFDRYFWWYDKVDDNQSSINRYTISQGKN